MMIFDDHAWLYALLLSNAILIAAAGIAVVRVRQEMRRTRDFLSSPAAAMLQPPPYDDRDLRRMFDRRMSMLEKYLARRIDAGHRQRPPEAPLPPQKNELPVEYAVRMAQNGASLDDLVRGCGLNRGEAQLLLRLHAKPPSQATTH